MSKARAAGIVALLIAIAVALAVGGYLLGSRGGAPDAEGVDAGFSRDMQTHHRQAVELSFILRPKTDDPALRTLTYDIINTQAHQAGQMYGWLDTWDLAQTSAEPEMAWMAEFDHDHGSGHAMSHAEAMASMGMAAPEEIQRLNEAEGVEAEKLFLELMIKHHEGALDMAQVAADHGETDVVRDLAAKIVEVQTSETRLMQGYLAVRQ